MTPTETTTQPASKTRTVVDCAIGTWAEPGQQPSGVALWLTVDGETAPLTLRIDTRAGLEQIVEALRRHGDEVWK